MARKAGQGDIHAFHLTQQLRAELWSAWHPDAQAFVTAHDLPRLAGHVVYLLGQAGMEVSTAYAIIHDKDMQELWSESEGRMVTCPKEDHVHLIGQLAKGAPLAKVAAAIGQPGQYIEKPKSKYSWDNWCAYLIHAKDSSKYQYDPAEVCTVAGPSYASVHAERSETWAKGRATKQVAAAKEGIEADDLRMKILKGEVTKEQIMLSDDLYLVYSMNTSMMDEALINYSTRRSMQAAKAMDRGEFHTEIVFVQGRSGSGKSTWIEDLIENIQMAARVGTGTAWEVFKVASDNPLDAYLGQEVVLMDDVRGGTLEAVEWLRLLDPYRSNPARARYKNKGEVAPRVIVIASVFPPEEYFFWAKGRGGDADEPMDQFLRRLLARVRVVYNDATMQREFVCGETGRRDRYEYSFHIKGRAGQGSRDETLHLTYGVVREESTNAEGAIRTLIGRIVRASKTKVMGELPVVTQNHLDRADLAEITRRLEAAGGQIEHPAFSPVAARAVEIMQRQQAQLGVSSDVR